MRRDLARTRSRSSFRALPGSGVFFVEIGDMGAIGVSIVDHDAPLEHQLLPRRQHGVALLHLGIERILSKGIEREQTVVTRVPVSRMVRVARMVEHGDADLLAVYIRRVV